MYNPFARYFIVINNLKFNNQALKTKLFITYIFYAIVVTY